MFKLILLLVSFIFYTTQSFAKKDINELNISLHEPLFVDLVRPINSKKGDIEINSLIINKNGKTMISPEIEYVIQDGLAVEFEVPISEEHRADALKFALQQRLPDILFHDYHNAIQIILEKSLNNYNNEYTFFYISGYNRNNISIVAMNGITFHQSASKTLHNIALYKNYNNNFAYGVEYNLNRLTKINRILPQIKYHFKGNLEIQTGVGVEKKIAILVTRFILTF